MTTTAGAVAAEEAVPARRTGLGTVLKRLAKDPVAVAAAVTVVVFLLAAVFADALAGITGQDPLTYHQGLLDDTGAPVGAFGGVSATHWFGVEPLTGRDLFAIVVHGARTSLFVGLAATALSMLIGTVVGLASGYFGGWFDRIVSRIVDVMFGFPVLVFLIALMTVVPATIPRPVFIVLVIGVFGWPGISRIVRGQALSVRERAFVVASKAMGAPAWWVMLVRVLPNISATVVVVTTVVIPGMIATEAALSFLGVGVPPPTPSWGRTIGQAIAWIGTDPTYLLFPGGALFLVTLGFNLLGDGLRDALDPRTARR